MSDCKFSFPLSVLPGDGCRLHATLIDTDHATARARFPSDTFPPRARSEPSGGTQTPPAASGPPTTIPTA